MDSHLQSSTHARHTSYAEREGWTIAEEYTDHATSGASLRRDGIQALIADAARRRFEVVLAEGMDRLSRDQEDIAGLHKRFSFAGVRIITLSEGEVTNLHVGLKGTMNALALQDLALKTRRGLEGRVRAGRSVVSIRGVPRPDLGICAFPQAALPAA